MIDIKNMARSTKRRVTSRLSTETDVEESLLASSRPSALRDVVLPDPDKAKPVQLATEADGEKAAAAAAADEPARKGGSPWLLVAAAVVLLGGGAAAWFATRGGDDSKGEAASAANEQTIAQADTPAAAAGGEAPGDLAEPEQPEPGAIATDDDGEESGAAGAGDIAEDPAEATPAPEAEPADGDADRKPDKDRKASRADRRGKKAERRRPESNKADEKKDEPEKAKDVGPAGDLDSLLDKAAGEKRGKKEEKKDDEESSAPKGKNKLTRVEVQDGMRSVKGRVAACYERFKQPGTVQVKVTIANTGVVTNAVATGKFANTDTGACVAKAVSTATFPEYNGPSMSLSYPFLLQ